MSGSLTLLCPCSALPAHSLPLRCTSHCAGSRRVTDVGVMYLAGLTVTTQVQSLAAPGPVAPLPPAFHRQLTSLAMNHTAATGGVGRRACMQCHFAKQAWTSRADSSCAGRTGPTGVAPGQAQDAFVSTPAVLVPADGSVCALLRWCGQLRQLELRGLLYNADAAVACVADTCRWALYKCREVS